MVMSRGEGGQENPVDDDSVDARVPLETEDDEKISRHKGTNTGAGICTHTFALTHTMAGHPLQSTAGCHSEGTWA